MSLLPQRLVCLSTIPTAQHHRFPHGLGGGLGRGLGVERDLGVGVGLAVAVGVGVDG